MTRTYVSYFSDDDLEAVTLAAMKLEADWKSRRPHLEIDEQRAGDNRLLLLARSIELLGERVP